MPQILMHRPAAMICRPLATMTHQNAHWETYSPTKWSRPEATQMLRWVCQLTTGPTCLRSLRTEYMRSSLDEARSILVG